MTETDRYSILNEDSGFRKIIPIVSPKEESDPRNKPVDPPLEEEVLDLAIGRTNLPLDPDPLLRGEQEPCAKPVRPNIESVVVEPSNDQLDEFTGDYWRERAIQQAVTAKLVEARPSVASVKVDPESEMGKSINGEQTKDKIEYIGSVAKTDIQHLLTKMKMLSVDSTGTLLQSLDGRIFKRSPNGRRLTLYRDENGEVFSSDRIQFRNSTRFLEEFRMENLNINTANSIANHAHLRETRTSKVQNGPIGRRIAKHVRSS